MFDIVKLTLATALAASGTLTVGYPTGRSKGNYSGSFGHILSAGGNNYSSPADFTLAFNANASNITLTWGSGKPTLAQGTNLTLQLCRRGEDDFAKFGVLPTLQAQLMPSVPVFIDLGSPNAAADNNISVSQAVGSATNLTITGVLASSSVATLDVPRGIQIVSANAGDTTQTLTITGTDQYGKALSEAIAANGTTVVFGKKAFKTVTQVASSASFAGNVKVGTSDVLGLPVFLPNTGYVIKELQDGATATAGTVVAGATAKATTTTGDIRGTYDPNAACDGDKGFILVAVLPDTRYTGVTQA